MTDTVGKTSFASLDDLFNASIGDLADLPAFETPPPGAYILGVTLSGKEVNDKPAVEAKFTVKETVELKNAEDKPAVDGTQFSQLFMIDNEFGLGALKKFIAPFGAHFGTANIGELVRDHLAEEVVCSATVKNRKDKKDPEKVYGSVEITGVI
jgi:hypothetical protein